MEGWDGVERAGGVRLLIWQIKDPHYTKGHGNIIGEGYKIVKVGISFKKKRI